MTAHSVDRDFFCFIQREDGSRVLGTRRSLANHPEANYSHAPRAVLDTLFPCLEKFPNLDQEGNVEVTRAELQSTASKGVPSMLHLRKISANTNDVLRQMKEEIGAWDPSKMEHRRFVRDIYDGLVNEVNKWEKSVCDQFAGSDQESAVDFNLTQKFLMTDFAKEPLDEERLHKTVTNIIHQYAASAWNVTFADTLKAVLEEHKTRNALKFRTPTSTDVAFLRRKTETQLDLEEGVVASRQRLETLHRQLNHFSDRLKISQRTFEKGTHYWIDLGTHAPSFQEWRSAVDQVKSEGWSKVGDIIRSWEGGESYNATYIVEDSKPSKKKRKRSKKKKGSLLGGHETGSQFTGTDLLTPTTTMSLADTGTGQVTAEGSVAEDPAEEELGEESDQASKRPSAKSRNSGSRGKNKLGPSMLGFAVQSAGNKAAASSEKESSSWIPEGQTMDEIRTELFKELSLVNEILEREEKEREQRVHQSLELTSVPSVSTPEPSANMPTTTRRKPRSRGKTNKASSSRPNRRQPKLIPAAQERAKEGRTSLAPPPTDISQWPTLADLAASSRSAATSVSEMTETLQEQPGLDVEPEPSPNITPDQSVQKLSAEPSVAPTLPRITVEELFAGGILTDDHDEEAAMNQYLLDEAMDLTGVDPQLALRVGRFAQHIQEQIPSSVVSVHKLVSAMNGWENISDFLEKRGKWAATESES